MPALCRYALTYFNPPAPCGAGLGSSCFAWRASNFNPPAPCGAGQQLSAAGFRDRDFNPPAPCGAGPRTTAYQITQIYFNPPAPCGAGRPEQLKPRAWVLISIHPPLAGRDFQPCTGRHRKEYFNPPAPCGAGPLIRYWAQMEMQFQSTRPLRGGTRTYAPSGERAAISIHPPLAGRDQRF